MCANDKNISYFYDHDHSLFVECGKYMYTYIQVVKKLLLSGWLTYKEMLKYLQIFRGTERTFYSFEWIFNESLYYKPDTMLSTEDNAVNRVNMVFAIMKVFSWFPYLSSPPPYFLQCITENLGIIFIFQLRLVIFKLPKVMRHRTGLKNPLNNAALF